MLSAFRRVLSTNARIATRGVAAAAASAAAGYGYSAQCLKLDLTIPVEIDGEQLVKALKKFELVDTSGLTKIAKDDTGLLPQPIAPKYRLALVQIYVRTAKYGGSDKSANGHRYDSIPFANGMINNGMSCQLIHYVHEEHDKFFEVMKNFDAIIVRCNPGQIKADGGSQEKFDDAMRGIQKLGIQVWPSPDVMEFMGAKDALTKIAHMNIGLPDTLSYYDSDTFSVPPPLPASARSSASDQKSVLPTCPLFHAPPPSRAPSPMAHSAHAPQPLLPAPPPPSLAATAPAPLSLLSALLPARRRASRRRWPSSRA